MRRFLLCTLSITLLALSAIIGGAFGSRAATERGLIRSSLADNTIQLLVVRYLRAGDADEALALLDRQIDARAVFLGLMLAEGSVPAALEPSSSCHLKGIREYRAENPFAHEDAEFGALVARVLALPAGCSNSGSKTALAPAADTFELPSPPPAV